MSTSTSAVLSFSLLDLEGYEASVCMIYISINPMCDVVCSQYRINPAIKNPGNSGIAAPGKNYFQFVCEEMIFFSYRKNSVVMVTAVTRKGHGFFTR